MRHEEPRGRRERPGDRVARAWAAADRQGYRLKVEYDGTRYAGFQVQPGVRTVAGELQGALHGLLGEPVQLLGAGRTDAGVHAEGQVVSFVAARGHAPETIRIGVNDRLPADINLLAVELVPPSFHPRHDALDRTYRYQVSRRRDAFRKRFVWWVKTPLDLALLEAEVAVLPGLHDFASFTDPEQEDAAIRVVRASWSEAGDLLLFHVTAERFAFRMVRRLVGAMVEVGRGRERPGLVARLLAEPQPGAAAPWTAPSAGLFLESVRYRQPK